MMQIQPIRSVTPTTAVALPARFAPATDPIAHGTARGDKPPATQASRAAQVSDEDELAAALSSINMALKDRAPGLEFSFDEDSKRTIIKVIDKDTQEVIRQMPSREALEIAKSLKTLQGLMKKHSV